MRSRNQQLESKFQSDLRKDLEALFPGCVILKNDANLLTGIPDLTILYGDRWAVLEVKRSADEDYRPNQEWYLEQLNNMSFATTIFPENKEEVLDALRFALRPRRAARVSQR